MVKNYFIIAFRNLMGTKVYSAINILGLSVGLACSFLILLWVTDETSYDRFHENGDRIYQAWRHMTTGGQIYNEETAKMISPGRSNFQDLVGTIISVYGEKGPIVGVVKNFSMNSLYSPIEPVVIRFDLAWSHNIYIRTKRGATEEALAGLETIYKKVNPGYPLKYTFLDQQFEQTYRSEQVMGKLANIFAVIALFISCLGLFGLTSFTVEQRTKELGVRKVLGASVAGIVVMLSKDFLRLVVVGFVIAVPFTYYAMDQWLENFADRVDIGAGVYLLAGLSAIVIALATVSWQSIRAAVANPVDCLRSE